LNVTVSKTVVRFGVHNLSDNKTIDYHSTLIVIALVITYPPTHLQLTDN